MQYSIKYLQKSSKIVLILTILLICIIGFFNYLSGKDLNLFILSLIPCIFSAWYFKTNSLAKFSVFISVFMNFIIDLNLKSDVSLIIIVINNILRFSIFYCMIYLVLYIKRINQKLENLSLQDPLTRLSNKRSYLINGDYEIKKMKRYENPLSFIFIDLDNFKIVNDTLGHKKGDELLLLTANILKNNLRETDTVARIGGDEFAIILPNMDKDIVKDKINNIHTQLYTTFNEICTCNVSSSIGIATFFTPPKNIYEATEYADRIMYKIKKTDKNGILQEVIN